MAEPLPPAIFGEQKNPFPKRLARAFLISLSAFSCSLAGCAIHINPSWKPPKPSGAPQKAEVFYVKDRKKAGQPHTSREKPATRQSAYAPHPASEGEVAVGLRTGCVPANRP